MILYALCRRFVVVGIELYAEKREAELVASDSYAPAAEVCVEDTPALLCILREEPRI